MSTSWNAPTVTRSDNPNALTLNVPSGPAASPNDLPADSPRYELRGEVAHGGMGVVYQAWDSALDREVAVKVIRPTLAGRARAEHRFLTEARITGQLQHPGIPPVFDLGTLPDLGPFLAMKLVRGRTLADLLAAGDDDRPTLLVRFEAACQAVAYAHSQGVIHRDLKPHNVMVGAFGEVQVMDWGLAKVLGPRAAAPPSLFEAGEPGASPPGPAGGDTAADRTEAGTTLGTPAYMAPEQARGEAGRVDERADVFALGAILLEILTGAPPFGGRAESALAAARAADLRPAFGRLDGCGADPGWADLCRACLAPDPAGRPRTAGEVAEAAAALRGQADERARRAELDRVRTSDERDRAERRVVEERRRRRAQATLGAAVLATVLTGGAVSLAQWRRAERALNDLTVEQGRTVAALDGERAEREAKAAALAALIGARENELAALRRMTDELVGDQAARRDTLTDRDRKYLREVEALWNEVAAARGSGPDAEALRAEGAHRVGRLRSRLGELADAEAALRAALATRDRLAAAHPGRPDFRRATADTRHELGNLLNDRRQDAEAEALLRAAAADYRALAAAATTDSVAGRREADVLNDLGSLLNSRGRSSEAEPVFRTALGLYARPSGGEPTPPASRRMQARAQANLATTLRDLGRPADAEPAFRAALDHYRAADAADPVSRRECATVHNNLGILLVGARRLADAETEFRASLRLREGLAAEFPAVPEYRVALARANNSIGILFSRQKKWADAEAAFRTAVALRERLVADRPDMAAYQKELGTALNNLGTCLVDQGKREEAGPTLRAALDLAERQAGVAGADSDFQVGVGRTACNLGILIRDSGRPADAVPVYDKAIAALTPVVRREPRLAVARQFLANSHRGRAESLMRLDRPAEAITDWNRAADLSAPEAATYCRLRRAACVARTDPAAAAAEVDELIRIGPADPDHFVAAAAAYAALDRLADADRERYAARAVDLLRRAVTAGLEQPAAGLADDPQFRTIRERADFQAVLHDLRARQPKVTPKVP